MKTRKQIPEEIKEYIKTMRQKLHGEFANNG